MEKVETEETITIPKSQVKWVLRIFGAVFVIMFLFLIMLYIG